MMGSPLPEIATKTSLHDGSPEEFEAYIRAVRCAATAEKYTKVVCGFLDTLRSWGYDTWESLPRNILLRWVQTLVEDGKQPATVQNYIASVKRYVDWMERKGVNVGLYKPDSPRVHRKIKQILPPEYLGRYMELASHLFQEPISTAVQLLPACGLRSEELCKLKLENIRRKKVVLREGVVHDAYVLQLMGKGGSERVVPLLDEGRELLIEYLTGWRKYRQGPWLFPIRKRPIATRTLRGALERMNEPLGCDFSPHTLRRTYAVRLWRSGVDATVIARVLGHRSVSTTYQHYLALDEDDIVSTVHRKVRGQ